MNEYLLLIVLGDGSFEGGEAATDNPYENLHLSMSRPRAYIFSAWHGLKQDLVSPFLHWS